MHAPLESHGPLDKATESAGPALRELAEAVAKHRLERPKLNEAVLMLAGDQQFQKFFDNLPNQKSIYTSVLEQV